MKYLTALTIGVFCLLACEQEDKQIAINESLNDLFERYQDFQYYIYPEYATYNGVHLYDDRLNDQSFEAGEQYRDSINALYESLKLIDHSSLDEMQQLNYELFQVVLEQAIEYDEFEIGQYLDFNQQNGYHIYFPQIVETQPLMTEADINNYFSRLTAFPLEADNIIEKLKRAKDQGIMLACPISSQVLSQLEEFASMDYSVSPLYTVKDKSEALRAHADELTNILKNSIQPAYQKLYDFFREDYQPYCRKDVGVSSVPGGREYYEYLVQNYTSSKLSPDEVFNIGISEVKRIREEITLTRDELGFADMELTDFFEHLRTAPAFYFTDKDDLLNGYREILSNMDTKLPDLFGHLPVTAYDLKEMEAYRAAAAPTAYYYPAPSDGSRPGYFYVNTYQLDSRPIYTMTALAMHEAVPGHHLQFAIANELEDVPWFRTQMRVTAFEEGWGLYAEYLGYESGMYDEPLQKMGALSFEMWRACRLIVDVGIHYKGWDRQKALDFLKENAPLSEHDMNSEIDRYISWPGQALAYKIGEIRIKALRNKAALALEDEFDVKEFHDVVLGNGNIPLDLLENNVDEWIESKTSDH